MVHVETIDLSQRGVQFPHDRVGMVLAQPYLSLTPIEPYVCTVATKPRQLAMVRETLAVSRAAHHGAGKTHFTIFPEYSIPGPEGIELIDTAVRDAAWPDGTVVIGGTDALTQPQYCHLIRGNDTNVDAIRCGSDRVLNNQWVNCAITWVKGNNGRVERWIQPKLHPAWAEMNLSDLQMFCGRSVYIFKGSLNNGAPYRFGTLVCFDWIANFGAWKAREWILDDLMRQAVQCQLPLSWLFIIQRNEKPSHRTFLGEVAPFFNQTVFPNALRDRACLVFANNAGGKVPGRIDRYGGSSIVFSHQSGFSKPDCAPTFSSGGPRFRDGSDLLLDYRDILFRERGACIHSFAQVNPASLRAGAAGRTIAVQSAQVFPVTGVAEPRAPAAEVPASIKWLNDELDNLPRLSVAYGDAPLIAQADAVNILNIAALRTLPADAATRAIKLAAQQSNATNADDWDSIEASALEHLVNVLDILALGISQPAVSNNSAHASIVMNSQTVDVVAIRGLTHEECIKHSTAVSPLPQRQVLLVSRDRDNTRLMLKSRSILQTEAPQLGSERKITDPASRFLYLGYERLLTIFRESTTVAEVEGDINAELAA